MAVNVLNDRKRILVIISFVTTLLFLFASYFIFTPRAEAVTKTPVGWLHTSGSKILNNKNKQHTIKSISWFGMETSNCVPHGLWTISLDSGLKTIADQGFNTVRLPFANECLTKTPNSVDFYKNPQMKNKNSQQVMDYFIERAGMFGLSVILDRHRPGYDAQSSLWYTAKYSETKWVDDWVMLAKRYKNNSTVIGADIHNEPHANACWGCKDVKTDWSLAAKKAGDKILAANSNWLIIVEGIEKSKDGSYYWWGGNLKDAGANPITLKVANRLVYSPHDYPSTVYGQKWFNASNYPNNLPGVWDTHWGYLHKQNKVPILLGEFGTKYETNSDKQWLASLVTYLKTNNMSFSFWSFNPNSGDTGGLVKDDWKTLETGKLKALAPLLGDKLNVQPSPNPPATTTPVTTPKPVTPSPSTSPKPVTTPKPSTTPTPVPVPKPTPTKTPTTPPATNTKVSAEYMVQNSWNTGYVAEFKIRSDQRKAVKWSITWDDPFATSIANAWGMKCSIANKQITCEADGYGEKNLQWESEVRPGVQVNTTGPTPQNPVIKVK